MTDDSLRSDVLPSLRPEARPGAVVCFLQLPHVDLLLPKSRIKEVSCISFWIKVYRRRDTVIVGTHEEYPIVFHPITVPLPGTQ